jgi:hypothetical protein
VRASFDASEHQYGSPRIHEDLLEQDERVSRKRVIRLNAGLLGEALADLRALFQRLMQKRAAVGEQPFGLVVLEPASEDQPADHARERARRLLVARPF